MQWANPLWELCELQFEAEKAQIIDRLLATISAAKPVVIHVSPKQIEAPGGNFWTALGVVLRVWARCLSRSAMAVSQLILGWSFGR